MGVIINSRLSFNRQVSAVCHAGNLHIRAFCYIGHLLLPQIAHTVACSGIQLGFSTRWSGWCEQNVVIEVTHCNLDNYVFFRIIWPK